MCHFSYDVMHFWHLYELCDVVNFLVLLKEIKKSKNSYCTSLLIDITKGSLHMVSELVRPETWDSLWMF
jgi:hypothetical protein